MRRERLTTPITVLGRGIRTSNADPSAIPPAWDAFFAAGGPAAFPDRLGDDIYAVYTHFEHEGVDNTGIYTLVIGVAVASDSAPVAGLETVVIPASDRLVWDTEPGRTDLVFATWQEIWRTDAAKTYSAEYEHYRSDGSIAVSIGVAGPV